MITVALYLENDVVPSNIKEIMKLLFNAVTNCINGIKKVRMTHILSVVETALTAGCYVLQNLK